jgi:hypothetical protein
LEEVALTSLLQVLRNVGAVRTATVNIHPADADSTTEEERGVCTGFSRHCLAASFLMAVAIEPRSFSSSAETSPLLERRKSSDDQEATEKREKLALAAEKRVGSQPRGI